MDTNISVDQGGDEVKDSDPDLDVRCGYGKCKPRWLQKLNNSKFLLALLCSFTTVQGFVLNGVNNVNTSTLERQFQLPSSRVGTISSAYDFSAAIIGVLASLYGSRRHIARWVSLSAVSFGAGSLIMALPHFVTGLYVWGDSINNTCSYNNSPEVCKEDGLRNYLYVLILGQCLHGLGGAILYTVGVGLIDDSVPSTSSPLYLGILYGFALLGPGIGYIVGGQFLNIYVDFDRVDRARFVFEVFHGLISNGLIVDHLNSIKPDNRLENICLVTQKENTSRDFTGNPNNFTKERPVVSTKSETNEKM